MELDELLESKKFWKALAEAFDKERGGDWDRLELADRIRYEAAQFKIRDFFQEQVIERLPRPHIVTAEELADIAIQQLAGLSLESIPGLNGEELRTANPEAWIGKTRFLAFVDAAILDELECDDDQLFNLGVWGADDKSDIKTSGGVGELWLRLMEDLRFSAGDGKEVVQIGIDLSDLLPEDVNPKPFIDRLLGRL